MQECNEAAQAMAAGGMKAVEMMDQLGAEADNVSRAKGLIASLKANPE